MRHPRQSFWCVKRRQNLRWLQQNVASKHSVVTGSWAVSWNRNLTLRRLSSLYLSDVAATEVWPFLRRLFLWFFLWFVIDIQSSVKLVLVLWKWLTVLYGKYYSGAISILIYMFFYGTLAFKISISISRIWPDFFGPYNLLRYSPNGGVKL